MKFTPEKSLSQVTTLCICLLISACGSPPKKPIQTEAELVTELNSHVIRINHNGLILPPALLLNEFISQLEETPVSYSDYIKQFDLILAQAETHARDKFNKLPASAKTTNKANKPHVKLLIHVHGGLNFFTDTEDRVSNLAELIKNDGENWHYPIFISWPSSPFGTYGEHLSSIRSGNKVDTVTGAFTAPFVLMTDVMQMGNIVSSMYSQVHRLVTEFAHNTNLNSQIEPKIWQQAKINYEAATADQKCLNSNSNSIETSKLYWSDYLYPKTDSAAFLTDYVGRHTAKSLTFPVRASVGTIYNSAIVESAWRNMKRRTKNIFYPPGLFNAAQDMKHVEGGRFFKTLLTHIKENSQYHYEITLTAHSMGTMVLNNAFKKYNTEWIASDALKNIVYMAAAASVQDTMDSVFPIITQINNKPDQTVSFYNLTLNRLADISETTVGSLLPNGSLLINIDDHLEHPEMPLDRTMGQEANVLSVLPVLNERLGRSAKNVQFKSFDRYYKYGPDKHGSFNKMPFWRQAFWSVDTQTIPPWNPASRCLFNGYPKNWSELETKQKAKPDTRQIQAPNCAPLRPSTSC